MSAETCEGEIKMSSDKRNRVQGFTLIEIMVVLVILGVLIAAVAPQILGRSDEARTKYPVEV